MVYQIPLALRQRLESFLSRHDVAGGALLQGAEAVSRRYRREKGESGGGLQVTSFDEAAAYAAVRMPATFVAVSDVLGRLREGHPDFTPLSLLDVGAGPGTASHAAHLLYEGLGHSTLIEPNRHLRDVGKALQDEGCAWEWQDKKLARGAVLPEADLVVVSYVLNELDVKDIAQVLPLLWNVARGALVIIEPGTPLGAGVIQQVREWARGETGAHILAPCPQENECPLAREVGRWCHFSARAERSRLHKSLKGGADLGYEDEKFSYIIVTRAQGHVFGNRLIGHPSGKKVIDLQLCRETGETETVQIPKSNALHGVVKKLGWGDGFDS
ncbi:MAG: small ribosomal subunit Rsm22 family protein [Pseudobdellovibrionaceae bacterium]